MIPGIRFAGIASGIKNAALDLGLVVFDEPAYITAVYTKNKVKSAHILYNKRLRSNEVEALLVNSGCANACTGPEGVRDLKELSEKLTSHLKAAEGKIMFASTGVIGRRLPTETMAKALPVAVKGLRKNGIDSFSRAIMTTDTYPKIARASFKGEKEYSIAGVAKGAGMINPSLPPCLFSSSLIILSHLRRYDENSSRALKRVSNGLRSTANAVQMIRSCFSPARAGKTRAALMLFAMPFSLL